MLTFFRQNLKWIGGGIVFFFVATMFTGSFFLSKNRNLLKSEHAGAKDLTNEIAAIGTLPISKTKYSEFLTYMLTNLQKEARHRSLNPELYEMIQYNALNQAVDYTILLVGAKNQKIKPARQEIQSALQSVYSQFDVKGNKELREILKKNNYPYRIFMEGLSNDISVQKFTDFLKSQAIVTDKDVENKYTKVNAQHILIIEKPDSKDKQAALKKINSIYSEFQKGKSFEDLARLNSQDPGTASSGGNLGWFGYGNMVKEFEEVAFALDIHEVSKPFKSPFGYHIVKILNKQTNKPAQLDHEKEKTEILNQKQSREIKQYISSMMRQGEFKVHDPSLKAVYAKMQGDISGAINSYQTLISQNPQSPVPHYYLAKLYLNLNQTQNAKAELQRAEIKGQLNKSMDFPFNHIELGKIYGHEKNKKEMHAQFNKAFELGAKDLTTLQVLQDLYKENNDWIMQKKTASQIKTVEALILQEKTATQNAKEMTKDAGAKLEEKTK